MIHIIHVHLWYFKFECNVLSSADIQIVINFGFVSASQVKRDTAEDEAVGQSAYNHW